MQIVSTIIPIFIVILFGWIAKKKDFVPDHFLEPANKIVYYFAIPAMIFRAISNASFSEEFNINVTLITLASLFLVTMLALVHAHIRRVGKYQKGTFLQSSFHGNLGYIGLAVVYYYLGEAGLAKGGIYAAFLMIMQNIFAVIVLQVFSDTHQKAGAAKENIKRIVGHPVIISATCGILFSLSGIPLPVIVDRTLRILSGMALPLALLLIGASISVKLMRERFDKMLQASFYKLIVLPGLGLVLFKLFSIPVADFLPAFVLLASPTATLAYVMARQMKGDSDFAVAAISGSTILSAVSFTLWLSLIT